MDDHEAHVRSQFEAEFDGEIDWSAETSFIALGVDSLQFFVLVTIAEELADREFPSTVFDQIESVGELVEWTVVALAQRSDAASSSSDG